VLVVSRWNALTPLQEKFSKFGFDALDDEESIRLFFSLCRCQPERDRVIERCVKHFGNLRKLLAASTEELQQFVGCPTDICTIKLLQELPTEILKERIVQQPVNRSSREIFDYLYLSMRDLKKEVFKVIYLSSQNRIIDTEVLFEGRIEYTSVHPREIIEATIKNDAVRLIFVHNHPSGDPAPSRLDELLTRDLVFIGKVTRIEVLDHIIIGENRFFSFADAGLIRKYEDEFLNIRIKVLDNRVGLIKDTV